MAVWQSRGGWRAALLRGVVAGVLVVPLRAWAQDPAARSSFLEGKRLAIEGKSDSSLSAFTASVAAARKSGDQATLVAAMRGEADVQWVFRGCADTARRILTDAVSAAGIGDRSAADALVRLLAWQGQQAQARTVLVKAYEDVPSVGRNITREGVTFLQGMSAIERSSGHESAALASLNSALQIAVRLHEGDIADSSSHAVGEITQENAWVMFDLAQLRLHAKSPQIASVRAGERIMEQLIAAWPVVSDQTTTPFPLLRIGDRLELQARACAKSGKPCPVPKPPKC